MKSISLPLPMLVMVSDEQGFLGGCSPSPGVPQDDLLQACVQDTLCHCAELSDAEPWLYYSRPSDDLEVFGDEVRALDGTRASLASIIENLPQALLIAADAPTLPAGYLKAAVELLTSGEVAWVCGPALDASLYLLGWGRGGRSVTLPTWYRLSEADGISRARVDVMRGCSAPHTARVIAAMENRRYQQERRTARLS